MIKLSDSLYDFLDLNRNYISGELIKMEEDHSFENPYNIEELDFSEHDYCFSVHIGGTWNKMKISTFLSTHFPGFFTNTEIIEFSKSIKEFQSKSGTPNRSVTSVDKPKFEFERVLVRDFKFEPLNVRETFLSLTTKTYPHGHEDELYPLIEGLGLERDKFGNYYKIIGDKPTTMFTSHLDTADRKQVDVKVHRVIKDGDEIFLTDRTTILGADDKAGVCVLMYLIAKGVKGVYYFFKGEERGGIGSGDVADIYDKIPHLSGIKRCVSFDRRNYHSVITSQYEVCCSDNFANELCRRYNSLGMSFKPDNTGVFTDSANFIDYIPECTNISVGYFKEHTENEHQNITFLEKLCVASSKLDWESLPVDRKFDSQDLPEEWSSFLLSLKKSNIRMVYKMFKERNKKFLSFKVDNVDIHEFTKDILTIAGILIKNKLEPDIILDKNYILIPLEQRVGSISAWSGEENSFGEEFGVVASLLDSIEDWQDRSEDNMDNIKEMSRYIRKVFTRNGINADVIINRHGDIDVLSPVEWCFKIGNLVSILEIFNELWNNCFTNYETDLEIFEHDNKNYIRVSFFTD